MVQIISIITIIGLTTSLLWFGSRFRAKRIARVMSMLDFIGEKNVYSGKYQDRQVSVWFMGKLLQFQAYFSGGFKIDANSQFGFYDRSIQVKSLLEKYRFDVKDLGTTVSEENETLSSGVSLLTETKRNIEYIKDRLNFVSKVAELIEDEFIKNSITD